MSDFWMTMIVVVVLMGTNFVSYKLGYYQGRMDEFNDKPE